MKNLICFLFLCIFAQESFAVIKLNNVPRIPYSSAISAGQVSNTMLAHGFFTSTDLTTTEKTVWDGPGIYVYPTVALQMTVSSTSTLDTLAGTGAQKISIDCLDINYEPFSEIVELDGQNPVTMSGSCFRVQGIGTKVIQVGSLEKNAGIIYVGFGAVAVGVPATIYNLIRLGVNASGSGFFTIPAGYKGFLYDVQASSPSNKPLGLTGLFRNGIPVFIQFYGNFIEGFVNSRPPFPDHFDEKTDIQFRAAMEASTGEVRCHAHLTLIK